MNFNYIAIDCFKIFMNVNFIAINLFKIFMNFNFSPACFPILCWDQTPCCLIPFSDLILWWSMILSVNQRLLHLIKHQTTGISYSGRHKWWFIRRPLMNSNCICCCGIFIDCLIFFKRNIFFTDFNKTVQFIFLIIKSYFKHTK